MMTIKLGLVQMRCEKGAIEENLVSTRAYLDEGMRQGVDIMCFPEMSITGYANPLRNPEVVLHLDGPEVMRLVNMTKEMHITAIAGIIKGNPHGKPFITQIVAHAGKVQGMYRKQTIAEDEVSGAPALDLTSRSAS